MTGFSRSARSAEREHGENQCTRDHRGLTIGRVITRGDYEWAGAQFIAQAYCALRPAGLPPSFPGLCHQASTKPHCPATLLVSFPAYRQLH